MTFRDLIEHAFHVYETGNEDEVFVDCPFCESRGHAEDSKHRLGINLATGVSHCFQCEFKTGRNDKHRKLRLFVAICEVFGIDEKMDDVELSPEEVEKKQKKSDEPVTLPQEFEPLWKSVSDQVGKRCLQYLLDRGITHEQIRKHRIGFCGVGKYSWRIVFPVYTAKKKLVGLVCRTIAKDVEPRYLNSPGGKTLYGVRRRKRSSVVLLEGITDQLAVERAIKKRDALGRLGSSLTEAQLKILSKYKEIIIWPDPDEPGIEGLKKTVRVLHEANLRNISVVPPLKDAAMDTDPGDIGKTEEGLREIRRRIKCRMRYTKEVADLCMARVLFMR